MSLRPLSDVGPAEWISSADAQWYDLVRYGPPGFEAYLNVVRTDDDELLRALCEVLARHTRAQDDAYFCLWDGWPFHGGPTAFPPAVMKGPRVAIGDPGLPERGYLLFGGALSEAGDWGADPQHGEVGGGVPDLFWPADHAWCVAADVDEDPDDTWRLGVGGSRALIDALRTDDRFDTVAAHPYG